MGFAEMHQYRWKEEVEKIRTYQFRYPSHPNAQFMQDCLDARYSLNFRSNHDVPHPRLKDPRH